MLKFNPQQLTDSDIESASADADSGRSDQGKAVLAVARQMLSLAQPGMTVLSKNLIALFRRYFTNQDVIT